MSIALLAWFALLGAAAAYVDVVRGRWLGASLLAAFVAGLAVAVGPLLHEHIGDELFYPVLAAIAGYVIVGFGRSMFDNGRAANANSGPARHS